MARRTIKIFLSVLLLVSAGCGKQDDRTRSHTFVTEEPKTPEEITPDEAAPLLKRDEKDSAMPAFEVPEKIRERVLRELPDFAPPRSSKFRVINQNLKINVKTSTMTFTGVLQIQGKADEALELQCKFDKSKTWTCADMFPVKPEVARERRLQATVNCLDIYRCDKVGLELFVRIDGRTESQLFQSGKFEIRKADSGDFDEFALKDELKDDPSHPGVPPKPSLPDEKGPSKDPLVFEKPRPVLPPALPEPQPQDPQGPSQLPPKQTSRRPAPAPMTPAITDEQEIADLMEDPNAAVEITAPMPVPAPARGEYSIPDIERLRPETGGGVANQAIGAHADGRLSQPAKLPGHGPGFIARPGRDGKMYGTDIMVEMLKVISGQVAQAVPNQSPILISNISKKIGGQLCNSEKSCHKSHQTGLDVDVAFPGRKPIKDLWSICNSSGSSRCQNSISNEFDPQRFWLFAKQAAGAQNDPVIAIFVDTQIKKFMCDWARSQGENISDPNSAGFKALRAMKYEPGHHNHFHMRLRCPGNRDCRNNTVSLGRGTGC